MEYYLNRIYSWLSVSPNMLSHLTKNNLCLEFTIAALLIAFFAFLFYYYFPTGGGHPRWNRPWIWSLVLVSTGFATLAIITSFTLYLWLSDKISPNTGISLYTCFKVGLINLFWAMIFFIIFSFALKWWSRNCAHSPC